MGSADEWVGWFRSTVKGTIFYENYIKLTDIGSAIDSNAYDYTLIVCLDSL